MRNYAIRALWLALWVLFAGPVTAVELAHLYQVNVAVADKSATALSAAQQRAFEQVLVKVSGSEATLGNDMVKKQLSNATDFMIQFGYLEGDGLQVETQFDQERVNRLLRQANLPIWGQHRQQALLWIAAQDANGREIVADSGFPELKSALVGTAQQRGLPILLPLMDLDDAINVSISDIWGQFPQPVLNASERYLAPVVVMAKSYPLGEQREIAWQLFVSSEPQLGAQGSGTVSAAEGEQAYVELIVAITEWMAQRYAVHLQESADDVLSLAVMNIDGPATLAEVMKHLQQLTAVNRVDLVRMQGQHAVFALHLLAGRAEVEAAIARHPNLSQVQDAAQSEAHSEIKSADAIIDDWQQPAEGVKVTAATAPETPLSDANGSVIGSTSWPPEAPISYDFELPALRLFWVN